MIHICHHLLRLTFLTGNVKYKIDVPARESFFPMAYLSIGSELDSRMENATKTLAKIPDVAH
jgi:hypothetical protein